ncbi:hypothetical protein J1605_022825 [Eschrichtius robustus]|uniref:Uncharacterized protein n=1 Tax=Eschrichtius robustus TaxID=9764 RepID=A0AB34H4F9_ESCRO|nr:hypothetical protein J1605_022825 [Eschrichtius robustus]
MENVVRSPKQLQEVFSPPGNWETGAASPFCPCWPDDDLGQCRCKWRGLDFKVPRKRRTDSRRGLGSAGGFMSDI